MRPISVRPIFGDGRLTALDVSDDGKIAVGFSTNSRAFIWHKGKEPQVRNLITFLKNQGAVVPDGWHLIAASLYFGRWQHHLRLGF